MHFWQAWKVCKIMKSWGQTATDIARCLKKEHPLFDQQQDQRILQKFQNFFYFG